jgi:CRP/FNR family cyclic AMP-dependent transcriptional regulator
MPLAAGEGIQAAVLAPGKPIPVLPLLFMTKKLLLTDKRKRLAAASLAQKIGYLKLELPDIPAKHFNAHKVIRPDNELFVIRKGVVEIWHTQQDMLVTELGENSVFGEMSLLGQTMLGCQAIVGSGGVTVGVVDVDQVTDLVDPKSLLQTLGPRLAHVEADHYRAIFQSAESRVAALILELAGEESVITGLTHDDLANQLGMYRETVTISIKRLKKAGAIRISRKKISILNKKALKELSEL